MDIRKLQRAIVDGLEDVKGQNIVVFNTEHLSALFERVVIASGTSNRQTKALAASVRDAVKSSGFPILRTEGEVNGEWIIVDCGAAVVHLMQPSIREYYHLEEIWGDKPVRLKLEASPVRLVKAAPLAADEPSAPAARQSAASRTAARKTAVKVAGKAATSAPRRAVVARPASDDDATPAKAAARKLPGSGGARRPAAGKPAATVGVTRTVGVKSPRRPASASEAVPAAAAAAAVAVAVAAPNAPAVPAKKAARKSATRKTADRETTGKAAAPSAPAAARKRTARKPADGA